MKVLARRLDRGTVSAGLDMVAVFASRLGGIAVNLLIIPIYTRLLSPADFGAVALLLSLQSFFLVSDLGLATVLARDTAVARGDPTQLAMTTDNRRRAELIMLATVMVVACAAAVTILLRGSATPIADIMRVVLAATLISFLVLLNVSQLCLNALGHYRFSGLLGTTGTVARAVVSAAVLAAYHASVDSFIQSQLVVAAVHYSISRSALNRLSGDVPIHSSRVMDRAAFVALLKRCRSIMLYTLGSAAALNLDKTILAAFLPLRITGWYFLATTYAMVPIAILSGPLNQYFAPRVALAEAQGDTSQRWKLAITFQLLLITAVVLPAFNLIRHASVFIPLWLHGNPASAQIAPLASLLLIGTAIGATGYYPTTYLIATADNRFLAQLSGGSAIVVLLAASISAAAGSLVSVVASYAIFHIFGSAAQWNRLRVHWPSRAFIAFMACGYVVPTVTLLGTCLLAWGISAAIAHGTLALMIEITLQCLLGGTAIAIVSPWCYRRATSLPAVVSNE